jgi:hypothetical protein
MRGDRRLERAVWSWAIVVVWWKWDTRRLLVEPRRARSLSLIQLSYGFDDRRSIRPIGASVG